MRREKGKIRTTRRLSGQYFHTAEGQSGPFHPSESNGRRLLYYKREMRTGEKRGKDVRPSHENDSRREVKAVSMIGRVRVTLMVGQSVKKRQSE